MGSNPTSRQRRRRWLRAARAARKSSRGILPGGESLELRRVLATQAFPLPLTNLEPRSAMAYATQGTAQISQANPNDVFQIALDAGQAVSVRVNPAVGLQGQVDILAPDNSVLATATGGAGVPVILNQVPAASAGTYGVRVTGIAGTIGSAGVSLIVNGTWESELSGGAGNGTLATAENLQGGLSLLSGVVTRGAVAGELGTGGDTNDWYRIDLADNQYLSLAAGGSGSGWGVELYSANQTLLAKGKPRIPSESVIQNFRDNTLDGSPATYYVRVVGGIGAYRLAYALDATLDAELNNPVGNAQPLGAAGRALGDLNTLVGNIELTRQKISAPADSVRDGFGWAVDIDNDWAIAGAFDDFNGAVPSAGTATLMRLVNGQWQSFQEITASDPSAGANFGYAVAIQGNWAFVGARLADTVPANDAGAVYVFQFNGTQWVQTQKLVASDAGFGERFGWSLDAQGSTLVVGAPLDTGAGIDAGAAYVYRLNGSTWSEAAKVVGADTGARDQFGTDVGVDGGWIVVSSRFDDDKATDAGAIYLFEDTGASIVQRQKLTAADGQLGDQFGKTVDISGRWVVVGATEDDDAGLGAGSAYVFERIGTTWSQSAKLIGSRDTIADDFGSAVSIDGDTLIVAARFDEVNGINDGAVYVYRHGDAGWVEEAYLGLDPPSDSDFFGNAVAIDGSRFIIGAPRNQTADPLPGLATFYNIEPQDDWYMIAVQTGDQLNIQTYTPWDGAAQPDNQLDPILRLYDTTGALVASQSGGAADGRNVLLSHTAVRTGEYRLQVSRETAAAGKYVLQVAGASGDRNLNVVAATPANNSYLPAPPSTFTVDFSLGVLATSIQATDLLINGQPVATGVTLIDGDTVQFSLPTLAQGTYSVAFNAGAMTSVSGRSLALFSSQFTVDSTAPRIVNSSVERNDVLPVGTLVYSATFDEAMLESTMDLTDVLLTGQLGGEYLPSDFVYDPVLRRLTVTFNQLPEDNYTLTLSGSVDGFQDLAGNQLDGELPAIGTVPSGNGVSGGDFVLTFGTDADLTAWPANLEPLEPLGSLTYQSQFTRIIGYAGDTDSYSLPLDAGQILSLELVAGDSLPGQSPLQGTVQVFAPGGQELASVTASTAGQRVLVQSVPTASAGTYVIRVSGTAGSTGVYSLRAVLNSVLETEFGTPSNNTQATAQSLSGAFVNLPLNGARLASVVGQLPSIFGATIAAESFESQSFDPNRWTLKSSGPEGRIVIRNDLDTTDGSYALAMYREPDGNFTLNEATYRVDLSSGQGALLTFLHADFGDEEQALPASFNGSANGDGVSISADGLQWYTIFNATDAPFGDWQRVTIDLAQAAQTAGITLGPNFRIKFQQYDNFSLGSDGRGYDGILVAVPQFGEDWYQFDAVAGAALSVALDTPSPNAKLQLINSAGTVVATGAANGNLPLSIADFRVTAGGAYYARITGNDNQYHLVVALDTSVSHGANQQLSGAQLLSDVGTVLGYVNSEPPLGQGISGSPAPAPASLGNSSLGNSPSGNSAATNPSGSSVSGTSQSPGASAVDVPRATTKVDRELIADDHVLLIQYREVADHEMRDYIEQKGWIVEQLMPELNLAVVRLSADQDLDASLAEWSVDPLVLHAEPDYKITSAATIPNDPNFGQQWHLNNVGQGGGFADADVDAPEAWDLLTGSSSVVVAVIDGGVDYLHPDLAANIWHNTAEQNGVAGVDDDGNGYVDDFVGIDTISGDSDPMDENGHGTHVAGILGAVGNNLLGVTGLAWNVKIMPLRFLSGSGIGTVSAAVEALNYITMMKTEYGVNIVASNNSWGGGGYSNVLQDAIRRSIDAGIVFVAAAGNDQLNNDEIPHYPSSYPLDGIISVGATDNQDFPAAFTNYGVNSVDIGAPGVGILSTERGGQYGLRSGTSMATPLVSAAVALLRASRPSATVAEVKAALLAGADPAPDLEGYFGGGRLNLAGAFAALGDPGDYFAFDAVAGDQIQISLSTPGDGPLLPANTLDAALVLYGPSNNELQSFTGPGSPTVQYSIPSTGRYKVRVVSESGGGAYMLRLTGASGLNEFRVTSVVPNAGQVLATPPTQVTVDFGHPILASSLQASDLKIDGQSALSVAIGANPNRAVFQIAAVSEGSHTVTIASGAVLDSASRPVQPFTTTFAVDQTPPSVTVTPLATSDSSPALTGTVNDPDASIVVTVNGQAYPAINNRDGSWLLADNQIVALPDGVYNVLVTATDPVGNASQDGTSGELLIDATPPTVTVNALLTNDNRPPLSGTVNDPTATLKLTVNGFLYQPVNHGDGTWTLADNTVNVLPDGTYDVNVEAVDARGNIGLDATTGELRVDTLAPVVTVAAKITKDSTPSLQGTVNDPLANVVVTVAGVAYPAVNTGDGTWSIANDIVGLPAGLSDAVYDVAVTATDQAGNVGTDSSTGELQVDTLTPVVTVNPLQTKDTTPAISGTVQNDLQAVITVTIAGIAYPATNLLNGTWVLADNAIQLPLAGGTYDVQVSAVDVAGNVGQDATSGELWIDLVAPVVTVNILFTNDSTPTVTGSVDDAAATVEVEIDGTTYPATVAGNGTWSVSLTTPMADGTYEVKAHATDLAGNVGQDTTKRELTVDTVAPTVTVLSIITGDSTPDLTGLISEKDATVSVTVHGQTLAAINHQDGTWSLAGSLINPLTPGTYNVQVQATDLAGNVATDSTTDELRIDPAAPSVTVQPLLTTDLTPPLTGTVSSPSATIVVEVNGASYPATNQGDGTWQLADNVLAPLSHGVYDVRVTATAPGGKVGTDTTINELRVDAILPVVSINPLKTRDNTPRLTGSVDDPQATIQVTVNGQTLPGVQLGSGAWELADGALTALPDGVFNVVVTATDQAGNVGTDASIDELVIDTVSPLVTINSQLTNQASPAISGTINDPTATIQLIVGDQSIPVLNPGNGTWTVPAGQLAPLAHGTYDIEVVATDDVGNVGSDQTADELVVDLNAPVVTVNVLITSDTRPALSGTVADPSATVQVTVNGVQYAAVNAGNGTWSLADNTIATPLADGSYDVSVAATDTAGNVGTDSTSNELRIDTLPPVVTVNALSTSDRTPALTGTVNDPSAIVHVTVNGVTYEAKVVGNVWTLADNTIQSPLADGTYEVAAHAVDDAGNSSNDSSSLELLIDGTAPVVTVVGKVTSDASPALQGTVDDPLATVSVTIGGVSWPAVNQGNGQWTLADNQIVPALADGTYDVVVTATDAVGNAGVDGTTGELTVDTTAPVLAVTPGVTKLGSPALAGTIVDADSARVRDFGGGAVADWAQLVGGARWIPGGQVGGGLQLDGVNAGLQVPDSADINLNQVAQRTISLWFRADQLPQDGTRQVLFEEGDGFAGLLLYLENGQLVVGGYRSGPTAWSEYVKTAPGAIQTGQWYHAALVLDVPEAGGPGVLAGYLDGTQFAAGEGRRIGAHGAVGVGRVVGSSWFGGDASPSNAASPFSGRLDEIRIDNRVLTGTELAALHAGNAVGGAEPVVLWSFQPPETTIEVEIDGHTYSALNSGDGTWSLPAGTIAPALAEGTYDVKVRATDVAGNVGTENNTGELVVDKTAPVVTVNSLLTGNTSPSLTGTVNDPLATISVTVLGTSYAATNLGNGTWSIPSGQLSPLTNGVYEVSVSATDLAGNTGVDATTLELTIDGTAPAVTVAPRTTSDRTPDLQGTVDDPAALVSVTIAGKTYAAVNLTNGQWTLDGSLITPSLIDGVYEVQVQATDSAGNVGFDSTTLELTIDGTAPVVTVVPKTTSDKTPALQGTVDDSTATVLVTVQGKTYPAQLTGNGQWQLPDNVISPPLSDGTYDVTVQATDPLGNQGVDGTSQELVIDTVAPVVTVTPRLTADPTPSLQGTVNDPSAEVKVTIAGKTYTAINSGNGQWGLADNVIAPALVDGNYNVVVTATDPAGNVGTDATSNELSIDTVRPAVINTTPAAGGSVPAGPVELVLELSEQLNPASVQADRLELIPESGQPGSRGALPATSLTFNPATRKLTGQFAIVPPGQYTVRLIGGNAGIRDLVDNRLLGNDATQTDYTYPLVVTGTATVVAHRLFYNNSKFDGFNSGATAADDAALAPRPAQVADPALGKTALAPGGTATFQNVSSYVRGINGLMIDISGLAQPGQLSASEFEFRVGSSLNNVANWTPLGIQPQVSVRAGAGANGSDRVTLIFPDGAIVDQWLEVKVLTGAVTGLSAASVVYWASRVGETGAGSGIAVTAEDLTAVATHPTNFLNPASVSNPYDVNRDGLVDGTDFAIVRDRVGAVPAPGLLGAAGADLAGLPAAKDRLAAVDAAFDEPSDDSWWGLG
ncbi:MAG: Ig-like domain-containing protein [Pirellulales bacterium]